MKQLLFLGLLIALTVEPLLAQDKTDDYVYGLFRGTRVVNGQSVESQKEGELDFVIAHRFGRVNGGAYEFFGLDQATMRWGLEYGIKDWVSVGFGRSTVWKAYDGFAKFRILRQTQGRSVNVPVSISAFSSIAINTLRPVDNLPVPFQTRLTFANQLLIARKFGDVFSFQLTPTHIHLNLVDTPNDPNDIFAVGAAAKVQVSKNVGVTLEYFYNLPNQLPTDRKDAIAVGIDINTGSHVFQLHFTNANSMIEQGFITTTTGDWLNGDIHIGFNMIRTFKLKGRRY